MQIGGKLLEVIGTVLSKAEEKNADVVLREALRPAELSPGDRARVSEAVFTYFRWFGWVDTTKPLRARLELVFDLAGKFNSNPRGFKDEELLRRAVPGWVHGAMAVTPEWVRAIQVPSPLWLRARAGQGSALAAKLGNSSVHEQVPDALEYRGKTDLYRTREFHAGEFEIQDLSSQIVGYLCAPTPGQTWWDACAGEGGKTLLLCDLMRNKGLVWASDPAGWRLDLLRRRASRAQIFNYRTAPWENSGKLPTKTKFDGVLVDAPCSGLGTWGRNPHARWTTTPTTISELAALQKQILDKVAESVKPGGKLIYSVCTLAHAETSAIANWFDASHADFEPLPVESPLGGAAASRFELLPQEIRANGMFIALWQRKK